MTIAVNILTWNGEDWIEEAVRSVMPYIDECYVYDSGSTDGTMKILKRLKTEFPNLYFSQKDVQVREANDLNGTQWNHKEKNIALTSMLNELKMWTKSEWILKLDDDEVMPEKTMLEIRRVVENSPVPAYSIPFLHFEDNLGQIVHPAEHRNFAVARLFRNIPEIKWVNPYSMEVIAYNGKKISSRANQKHLCRKLKYPFLHLGDLRKPPRHHSYRYHEKGHCKMSFPNNLAMGIDTVPTVLAKKYEDSLVRN